MDMTIRVLVDNNTYIDQYYIGEPAAGYYIEADGLRILFDTGYSGILLENAAAMGIDLSRITHLVISHGHNDHTGGLAFLSRSFDLSQVQVVAHPDCFLPRRYGREVIGAPFEEDEISRKARWTPSRGPLSLSEHCVFLGEIPVRHAFEARLAIGHRKIRGTGKAQWEKDCLWDDSALAIKTARGLFIVTGCSHSGICNIADQACQVCGETRIAGILGGFHLLDLDERARRTIEYLSGLSPEKLYPCHCVSLKVKALMCGLFDVEEVGVGMDLSLEVK